MLEKYVFFHKMFSFVVFFLQKFGSSKKNMYLCTLFRLFKNILSREVNLAKTINNYL